VLELKALMGIKDKRRGQGRMYDLAHVVLCCIVAVASGADSYRAIARFMQLKLDWLRQNTALKWRQAPSHTGLRAILLGLDQLALEQALREHTKQVLEQGAGAGTGIVHIAIDGKTLRGSLARFADVAPLQWLSAFATEARLVVGQVSLADADKGGEIGAAQKLIEALELKGKLYTLDALHCQKKP
jgi:hypothetical protein